METLPHFGPCFVCGHANAAGLNVRFQTDGERVFTTLRTRPEQMGYPNVTHGGILAALLDETMGWAPALANRRFCMSVELTVRYLKPLPVGTEITVTGRVVDHARRIWEAEGEVVDSEGTVYARGRGRYIPMTLEQTREVTEMLTFEEGSVPAERISGGVPETAP